MGSSIATSESARARDRAVSADTPPLPSPSAARKFLRARSPPLKTSRALFELPQAAQEALAARGRHAVDHRLPTLLGHSAQVRAAGRVVHPGARALDLLARVVGGRIRACPHQRLVAALIDLAAVARLHFRGLEA